MNEQEQRIAIAEACGWRFIQGDTVNGITKLCGYVTPSGQVLYNDKLLPDYLHDLNAMHEAEKALTFRDQPNEYQNQLIKVAVQLGKLFLTGRAYPMDGYVIHATAAQRAEAFLRTIGKWRD